MRAALPPPPRYFPSFPGQDGPLSRHYTSASSPPDFFATIPSISFDVLIGQLLHFSPALVQLVLGHLALFLRCLELFNRVAPDIAQRDLASSPVLTRPDQLLTALLCQRREIQPDLLAIVLGLDAQSEVWIAFFNRLENRSILWLDRKRARVGRRDGRHPVERVGAP